MCNRFHFPTPIIAPGPGAVNRQISQTFSAKFVQKETRAHCFGRNARGRRSDQPVGGEGVVEPVLLHPAADLVGGFFQGFAAVAHADGKAGGLHHFQIVHAVPKGHRVRQGDARGLGQTPDGGALVELLVDQLAVDDARGVGVLDAEVKVRPQKPLGLGQGLIKTIL